MTWRQAKRDSLPSFAAMLALVGGACLPTEGCSTAEPTPAVEVPESEAQAIRVAEQHVQALSKASEESPAALVERACGARGSAVRGWEVGFRYRTDANLIRVVVILPDGTARLEHQDFKAFYLCTPDDHRDAPQPTPTDEP